MDAEEKSVEKKPGERKVRTKNYKRVRAHVAALKRKIRKWEKYRENGRDYRVRTFQAVRVVEDIKEVTDAAGKTSQVITHHKNQVSITRRRKFNTNRMEAELTRCQDLMRRK